MTAPVIPLPRRHMSTRLAPKDIVVFKAGGGEMLVTAVAQRADDGTWCADCMWLNCDGEIQRHQYPIACLVLVHKYGEEWPDPIGIDLRSDGAYSGT